jgi:hypothetical protein
VIPIALALAQSLASNSVRAYLDHRALSHGDLDDVSSTVAASVVRSLLSADVPSSGALPRIEQKIDDLTTQHARTSLRLGQRLLQDAVAPHRGEIARNQLIEQARHAFLDAASAASPGLPTVEAELWAAGCWIALGSAKDVDPALSDALTSCFPVLLDTCRAYWSTPGLLADYNRRPVFEQIFYTDADRVAARRQIRVQLAEQLTELGDLVNNIQHLRQTVGGLFTSPLRGVVIDGENRVSLDALTPDGRQLHYCEPEFEATADGFALPGYGLVGGIECTHIKITSNDPHQRPLFYSEPILKLIGASRNPSLALLSLSLSAPPDSPKATARELDLIRETISRDIRTPTSVAVTANWADEEIPIAGRIDIHAPSGSVGKPTDICVRFRVGADSQTTSHVVRIHATLT